MVGIFSKTTDSNLIEAIGYSGLDFIILDQEHGIASHSTIYNHVRAAKLSGMLSVVRVAENNHNLIGKALDSGVDAVQIPNITSVDEAVSAINAARFYPSGMRGICCYVRAANFGTTLKDDYFVSANKKKIILQIEGKDGIQAIDDILKLTGFDVLFIGPFDLSQSLGYPGQVDHPTVVEVIQKLSKKVMDSGKILGTFVDSMDKIQSCKENGYGYIAYSVDLNIFSNTCKEIKANYEK